MYLTSIYINLNNIYQPYTISISFCFFHFWTSLKKGSTSGKCMASSLPLASVAHLIQHGRGMYFDCYLWSAFAAAKHGARTGLEMDRNTIPNLSVAWAQSYLRSTNNRHSNVSSVKNMILKTSSADDCKQCITMSHKHVMLRRLELQKMVWRTNWFFSMWRRFVGSKFQPFILWRGSNPSRLSTVSGMVLRLCSVFFGVFDVSSGVS